MGNRVIITCALTGGGDTVGKSPAVPVTPAEIAQQAIDAGKAGAAIAHIHVRDPDTAEPSMDLDLYRETVARIRDSGSDVLINLTTGAGGRFIPGDEDPARGGPGTTLTGPVERVAHVRELSPDICSLDMGSMNFGRFTFINTPDHLSMMARVIKEAGVKPELEVFEPGHIRLARQMIDDGLIGRPPLFQICLGIPWTAPATVETMSYMRSLLPPDAQWAGFGIGGSQFPMAVLAAMLGGHVRVGLEDNLYLKRGVLAPSNAALVEKAANILEQLGHAIQTPTQARHELALRDG